MFLAECNTVCYKTQKAQEVFLCRMFAEFSRINSCHFSILKHLVYGGPDGELGASMRYLSQRYSMKDNTAKALLTDIGKSWDYCSHTGHQPLALNLTPFSICVGANLNKHPNALCQKLQSCQ